MIDFSKFNNIISLTSYLNNEDICKQTIIESRCEDGDVVYPYCGAHHCSIRSDGRFRCNHCKKNFSCLVRTIFENTKVSLIKWFVAMYLISSHKKVYHRFSWPVISMLRVCCMIYASEGT